MQNVTPVVDREFAFFCFLCYNTDMSIVESSPVEPRREVRAPLNGLGSVQRSNLHAEMRSLSTELEEGLFVVPFRRTVELKGINLRSLDRSKSNLFASLQMTETLGESFNAKVTLETRTRGRRDQHTYLHRPSFEAWEEWSPGATENTQLLTNASFVGVLEPILPAGMLESVMDRAPKGTEIAQLLAGHLKSRARTTTERTHFKTSGVEVGGPEYVRDTDFVVEKINARTIRSLFVAASLDLLDYGDIRKVYEFTTIENSGILRSANGLLRLYSDSTVPTEPLNAFVTRDQADSDAAHGLHLGINDIRKKYSYPEI